MTRAPRISTLLALLEPRGERLVVLGELDDDSGYTPLYTSPTVPDDPDRLPAELRADVALVIPSAGDALPSALLARLRDVHVAQIVLAGDHGMPQADMLALGFETVQSPSVDGLVYVWDASLADKPREWNNARDWANPENFDRYRW